jgi:heterodisulfide reductase subunit A
MNIELLTLSEVTGIEGEEGDFTVSVRRSPRFVDMEKCIACGTCAEKCPAKADDEYNEGISKRKAIYVPYPQAVPLKYVIDKDRCIYFQKGKCKACEKFCPTGAIRFDDREEEIRLQVGSVVFTGGLQTFDPTPFEPYGYGKYPNVVTSLEFERILSAGGPSGGHVLRPSDGREPARIAWIQCVGSRDQNRCDHPYCSSVCCMYAIKEALIAKEHIGHDFEPAVFFMDMRTHGKDFEKYYERAKSDGVRFVRSRIHTISQADETGTLLFRYATESGEIVEEPFDMAVLSVGMEPSASAVETAKKLGLRLTSDLFVEAPDMNPVATSRPGIYVAGVIQGPKDIPQSVMEASAAACAAGRSLSPSRGTLVRKKEFPGERAVLGEEPRIGVFVCRCGTNIGGIADVPAVVEYAKTLPHVVAVEENLFTCSQDTQHKMIELIEKHGLNRIVVAACTPRTHEPLFQETVRNAGLNPYLFEMANIRNQCTWVHSADKDAATVKAKDLVRMAVARVSLLEPIPELTVDVNKSTLVIGGGMSGMTAALGLADQGFEAVIVEKSPELGGAAREITRSWKGTDVQSALSGLIRKVEAHPSIRVLLNAEIADASGFVGNFETTVSTGGRSEKVSHGALIVATGGEAADTDEYLYGKSPRVTRWHELDKNLQKYKNPSAVAFIQCVGSRDETRPYCSRVCCTNSVLQALTIKETNPDTEVYVLYRDMRTFGEREELYRKAREKGVIFIRYSRERKPKITETKDGLEIVVFDPTLQREIAVRADLLNLATAIEPRENDKIATLYKLPVNQERFFMEAHAKLRPVDFASDGIFVCGLAHYPKPLDESISQAMAAVGRAATVLSRPTIAVSPLVSKVDAEKCIGCGLCTEVCGFGAIVLEEVAGKGYRAVNIPASCKGCGLCAASCPRHAIDMLHFRDRQIVASLASAG